LVPARVLEEGLVIRSASLFSLLSPAAALASLTILCATSAGATEPPPVPSTGSREPPAATSPTHPPSPPSTGEAEKPPSEFAPFSGGGCPLRNRKLELIV
jgi:hypothetical protein